MSIKLGHFELREQIGKGGMAAVFRAYDPSLNREVAIKLLDEDLAQQDPQYVENFIAEAKCAAGIAPHPNIVQIYFVGEENGNYYIAMELLKGEPLDELIQKNGPMDEERVLRIGLEIASALKAAYAKEMIHGDIKPQNIFITSDGTAKLLDFGLAKMANIEVEVSSDGSVWGSAYYISPERIGRKAEDFRSDIYSLGATLFHTLMGTPPFDAETSGELAQKRLHSPAPLLRSLNPEISVKTEQVIARMLNKSAFLRYLDYDSMIADLYAAELDLADPSEEDPAQGQINRQTARHTTRHIMRQTSRQTARQTGRQTALQAPVAQAVEETEEEEQAYEAEADSPLAPAGSSHKKSPLPLIVGGVAGLAVLGLAVFMLQKKPAVAETPVKAVEPAASPDKPEPSASKPQQAANNKPKPGKNGPKAAKGTYKVEPGAFPWFDKVGVWSILSVPDNLQFDEEVPQQSCASHSIAVPPGTSSITVGVHQKDLDAFMKFYPDAVKRSGPSNVKLKNTSNLVLSYHVVRLKNPPAKVDVPGNLEGLLLLKLE